MRNSLSFMLILGIFTACNKSKDNPIQSSTKSVLLTRYTRSYTATDIYVIGTTDTNSTRLTTAGAATNTYINDPSWGPNDKIFFTGRVQGEGEAQIYVMNNDGSAITRVTNDLSSSKSQLHVTPTAQRLVYVKKSASGVQIVSSKLDGSNEKILTSAPNSNAPSWHPDGTRVVYVSPELSSSTTSTPNNIYLANYDGTNKVKLTNTTNRIYKLPFISPDGTKMCYSVADHIYVANIDGTGEIDLSEVVNTRGYAHGWSSDGQWIVVLTEVIYDVSLVKPDGKSYKRISTQGVAFDPAIK